MTGLHRIYSPEQYPPSITCGNNDWSDTLFVFYLISWFRPLNGQHFAERGGIDNGVGGWVFTINVRYARTVSYAQHCTHRPWPSWHVAQMLPAVYHMLITSPRGWCVCKCQHQWWIHTVILLIHTMHLNCHQQQWIGVNWIGHVYIGEHSMDLLLNTVCAYGTHGAWSCNINTTACTYQNHVHIYIICYVLAMYICIRHAYGGPHVYHHARYVIFFTS